MITNENKQLTGLTIEIPCIETIEYQIYYNKVFFVNIEFFSLQINNYHLTNRTVKWVIQNLY